MTTPRLRNLLSPAACLLLALVFARAASARQPAKAAPLDPQAYAAQLTQCTAALSALRGNPAGIERFRRSLPAEWDVREENRTFRVSTGWLDSSLAQIETHPAAEAAKWREIRDRLDFLREQAASLASPATVPSSAMAARKLDAIFRQREFRGLAGPGPLALWWRRLVGWIDEAIAWLLAKLHLGALSGNLFAYGLIITAVIFLLLWGWRTLAGRMRETQTATDSGPRQADARKWTAEALAAAERGELREAIHCAYWASVARLEQQGAFSSNRSSTPREMLRSIAPESREQEPFRELTHSFELVWYGYRSPSPADWENTRMQMERIGCLGFSSPPTAGS
ncbi:MAG TPA: DUF4129 domain-containing protein [Candidatus Dormibacteraeota bacterium]|nr:DUF4129 domain-containing protein [Candidatus Dormibacteraeota bacterium]